MTNASREDVAPGIVLKVGTADNSLRYLALTAYPKEPIKLTRNNANHTLRSSNMNARTQESNLSNGTENNRNLPSNIISTQNYPVSYIYSGHCDNIDERDQDDPLCATEYVEDMYEYFRSSEGDDLSPTKLHGKSAPHQQKNEDNSC